MSLYKKKKLSGILGHTVLLPSVVVFSNHFTIMNYFRNGTIVLVENMEVYFIWKFLLIISDHLPFSTFKFFSQKVHYRFLIILNSTNRLLILSFMMTVAFLWKVKVISGNNTVTNKVNLLKTLANICDNLNFLLVLANLRVLLLGRSVLKLLLNKVPFIFLVLIFFCLVIVPVKLKGHHQQLCYCLDNGSEGN